MNKYKDLAILLNDQIKYIPIEKNQYYINSELKIISSKNRLIKISNDGGSINFFIKNKGSNKFALRRIYAYIQSGLTEGMLNINDSRYSPYFKNNKWTFLTKKLIKLQPALVKINYIKNNNQDLLVKDGFYDEGIIPYKEKPGFYFVPTTNGSLVFNLETYEAYNTYNDIKLKIQNTERGEQKFLLNKRICGKGFIYLHRAIAYLTLSIPLKYNYLGKTLKEIILKLEVDHIDGYPENNKKENLQYLTSKENLIKKLEQEKDPRVFPTTWKSPEGKTIRFRSLNQVKDTIGIDIRMVNRIFNTWKSDSLVINGWTLLSEKKENEYNELYIKFENSGVDRMNLTKFKNGLASINIINNTISIYNNTLDYITKTGIKKGTFESHVNIKGPLFPLNNFIVLPLKYLKLFLSFHVTDIFNIRIPKYKPYFN